jgi:dethiobiotin synthetase
MRYFVSGTDTGVGKTEVALALLTAIRAKKLPVVALKPYQSGGSDDAFRLQAECVYEFKKPLAPGVAAELEGVRPSLGAVLKRIPKSGACVVEGAGGLYVPVDARNDVIDLMVASRLPVVLVARLGLGTLNHTALSLMALDARKIKVSAVVLVKSGPGRDEAERYNLKWLRRRHPRVRFLGPVGYFRSQTRRATAFRHAVDCLV